MQKVYFIPGLGADSRLFSQLRLENIEPVYLEYFTPEQHETIENYAIRMCKNITEQSPIIVGVSFGGLMAHEIALQIPVKKTILISTIKNSNEKPLRYKLIEISKLQNIVSVPMIKQFKTAAHFFFGTKTKTEVELLDSLIDTANAEVVRWSIDAFLKWNRKTSPPNCIHIHGDADFVFPIADVKADYIIKKGNHLMVYTKAKEVSELLGMIFSK